MIRSCIGAAMALGLSAAAAAAQDVTLRLHQMLPVQATIPSAAIEPWIAKVEADSDGRIDIQHFPSMQLGGAPPSLYDQARDGTVDIVWTVLGYTPGRFPKTEAFELPFMVGDAEAGSRAFHEYVEAHAMDEFQHTKPLVFHVHGPGWFHTTQPLTSIDDVEGMKLRGPTRVTVGLLEELGATPVGMPVPAVPEAVSKGVVDGAIIPWEVTLPLKMSELTGYHAGFAEAPGLYTATFVMTMNRDSYDRLPDDLKAVIDANSGPDVAALFGAAMAAGDVTGRQVTEEAGNSITPLDGERDRWLSAAETVRANWIAEMADKGIDGAALIEAAETLIGTHDAMN